MKIKPTKDYSPTRLEVAKTVMIAILLTGIISFIAGATYADSLHDTVQAEQSRVVAPAKK